MTADVAGNRKTESMLFLVDTQNIYYSAKSLYGERARIDFKKLKDIAADGRSFSFIKSIAFLADFKLEDDIFTNVLKKFGYQIMPFEKNACSAIEDVLNKEADDFDIIVVGSGAGDLLSICEKYKDNVNILAFPDALHAGVKETYETIILDDSVLVKPSKRRGEDDVIRDIKDRVGRV